MFIVTEYAALIWDVKQQNIPLLPNHLYIK